MTHVHLIGIGGSGLSAIATVLLESGYTVSGSDRLLSPLAQHLQAAGVEVFSGHLPGNVDGADLVIRSSAVSDDNPEVQAARLAGIPVLKRSDFLGSLMEGRLGIAISGTHGKTTTTAMIAWMLAALDQDPTYIIGGVSQNLGVNAHAGKGQPFVIEADEYDRMFLGLNPKIAVVTNIEHDHPDCYPTPAEYYQAFIQFAARLQPGGLLVACSDDLAARRLLADVSAHEQAVRSYGIEEQGNPDYRAINIVPNSRGGFNFEMSKPLSAAPVLPVSLQVPGLHNVRNALAALAVADQLGLGLEQASQALSEYRGTGRRFEVLGESLGITVIDDYAHHPTEIRATLSAARARYPGRPLWAVWQPHTYSRTSSLFAEFASAFQEADHVLVLEIYAAREPVSESFSSQKVVEAMQHPDVHFIPTFTAATGYLLDHLNSGDVLLVLSAGDADQISAQVLSNLKKRSE